MSQADLHPVLDLDAEDGALWLAQFCDPQGRQREPPFDLPFPLLRPTVAPHTWLIDLFRRSEGRREAQDRFHRSVLRALERVAGNISNRRPESPVQALGELLEVAGKLRFREPAGLLKSWIRNDWRATATYLIDSRPHALRETIWAFLIALAETDGLKIFLKRDAARPELECQALCFAELGKLSPTEGIGLVPEVVLWKKTYWKPVIRRFLLGLGSTALLGRHHREAWQDCLASIYNDRSLFERVAGAFRPRRRREADSYDELTALLAEVGIEVDILRSRATMRDTKSGRVLHLDLHGAAAERSERLQRITNEAWAQGGFPFSEVAEQPELGG